MNQYLLTYETLEPDCRSWREEQIECSTEVEAQQRAKDHIGSDRNLRIWKLHTVVKKAPVFVRISLMNTPG